MWDIFCYRIYSSFIPLRRHPTISQGDGNILQGVVDMVEEKRRVISLTRIEYLEVQMLGSCPTRAPRQSNYITSFHSLSHFHQVSRLVRIERFQSIRMFDANAIAITIIHF